MKRWFIGLALVLVLAPCALSTSFSTRAAGAEGTWTSVRSKNFFLVGNASENEIRKVALKLEQFREVFSRVFQRVKLHSEVPTTVIVFKNDGAYRPFKPLYDGKPASVAGYFQSGEDTNYITLSTDFGGRANPYAIIFHEYVHALTRSNTKLMPPWFNEGLAEYYSTFEVTDGDRKALLGTAIASHVFLLRERKFLPLETLFAVDHRSEHYNERDKKGVFYAQSWALMHYLLLGNEGRRQPQFLSFISLIESGRPVAESFREAFKTDFATIEKELRDYISRNSYPQTQVTFGERIAFDVSMTSAALTEAQAQYYLGDLLRHINRSSDAEVFLRRSIELEPKLAEAHASLGMLRMRERQFAVAKDHLARAVESDSANYLAHYYYAYTLSREGMNENGLITSYAPETAEKIRSLLRKTIELNPSFAESYNLMAFVDLITGEQFDEAVRLIKKAQALVPGREEFSCTLAQIYLRRKEFDEARREAEPVARLSGNRQLRAQAQSIVDAATRIIEQEDRVRSAQNDVRPSSTFAATTARSGENPGNSPPSLRRIRSFEGEKVRGLLTHIDCDGQTMTLTIKAGEQTLKFHAANSASISWVSFVKDVGETVVCGPQKTSRRVRVTYRSSLDASSPFNGEPIAVEFISPDEE